MQINVLTIFPGLFHSFLEGPLVKRAIASGQVEIHIVDIRDFADGSYRHIDDSPYGGGPGMILKCEPVLSALKSVQSENSHSVLFSPAGKTYTQKKARAFLKEENLILICGHYEGLDERITERVDEEISMGDYILSGGELPAMTLMDSLVRLMGGTIRKESTEDESFENGLLEYPQYTKPRVYEGKAVPEVLLSGHAERIRLWRLKESLRKTLQKRPDLLEQRNFTQEELRLLEEIRKEENHEGN